MPKFLISIVVLILPSVTQLITWVNNDTVYVPWLLSGTWKEFFFLIHLKGRIIEPLMADFHSKYDSDFVHAAAYCGPFIQTHERMWNQKSFTSSWSSICSFSFSTIWLWWLISSSFSCKDTHVICTVLLQCYILYTLTQYRYFLHCWMLSDLHRITTLRFTLHLPLGDMQ